MEPFPKTFITSSLKLASSGNPKCFVVKLFAKKLKPFPFYAYTAR